MKRIFITTLTAIGVASASSIDAGGPVFDIYPGARPTGIAGAFTAFDGDIMSIYYNDAGLATIKGFRVYTLQHSNWLQALINDAYYEFGAVAIPTSKGVIGVSLTYLTIGEVTLQDMDNPDITYSFVPYDVILKTSFARKINEKLSFGLGASVYYSFLVPAEVLRKVFGIYSESEGDALTFTMDGGILYRDKNYSIGASLLHIGPHLHYTGSDSYDPLPWTLRVGAKAHRTFQNVTFTLSADLSKILVNIQKDLADSGLAFVWKDTYKHVGMEVSFADLIYLRFGYFEDLIGSRVGPTFGLGAKYQNFAFDISDDRFIYEFTGTGKGSKPNFRFQLTFLQHIKEKPRDTLPDLIVIVRDSTTGKPISATVTLKDKKEGKVISAEGKGNIKLEAKPGDYLLLVENPLYERFEGEIHFAQDGQKVEVNLVKKPHGTLIINLTDSIRGIPVFGTIMIGDIEADTNRLEINLPVGTYALRVESPDYAPYYNIIEVREDSTDTLNILLTPITSNLNVKSDGYVDIIIYKDGNPVLSETISTNKTFKLGPGTFTVVVRCDACGEQRIELLSKPGHDLTLEIREGRVELKEGGNDS